MPIQLDALEQAKSTLIDLAIKFGPKVLVAILIAIAGFYAARWGWKSSQPLASQVRSRAAGTFAAWTHRGMLVGGIFIIMALQNLGVELLPLIAGLGVRGRRHRSWQLQGVLGNLAAGLTIIFTRPFRVGEYVASEWRRRPGRGYRSFFNPTKSSRSLDSRRAQPQNRRRNSA